VRILFLHEVNYLTKPIFEMHEFPEHLARLGHEVGFVHFPEGYSQSQIRGLGWRTKISGRVVDGVELDLFTPWTFAGGLLGRLFAATVSYWQFKRVLREYRPDVVVSFSVPTSGWQALLASKQEIVPFVFRALDVSHMIRQGALSWLVEKAERFVYKHADSLSANNAAMLAYCEEASGRSGPSSIHFPPIDLTLLSGGDREKGRHSLALDFENRVVLYLGSFFYFSGLPEVVMQMKTAHPKAKLVLVGGGEQDLELRSLVRDAGLERCVTFTGMVPFEALPDLLASADVAINPMKKTLVSDSALPNKVLQYMAAGVPVVSTHLDGLAGTFGDSSGITWADSPQEVARAALELAFSDNRQEIAALQNKAILRFGKNANPAIFEDYLANVVLGK
jgi:glycosyltransferase involved in cell wall biosynthesis